MPLNEDDVKKLVARAVEGLRPDNVGVVYKKIEARQATSHTLIPLLGNQEFLLAALMLLAAASIGLLVLIVSNRMQRSKLEMLQLELAATDQAAGTAQLVKTPVAP